MTDKESLCWECNKPIEPWEIGFCDDCYQGDRKLSHESKLRYVNKIIDECNAVIREAKACREVLAMLPKEVKDLTADDCFAIDLAMQDRART